MKYISVLNEIGIFDILDIIVMSFLIYTVLAWFKKTRAAFVLTGILIIGGVYLIARQFNLFLTASVFQGFFAVILVAVVVIFQEELRHFFERVAVFGLRARMENKNGSRLTRAEVAVLVRTVTDLAKSKTGALLVIQGQDMILRHLEGGLELGGTLSEPLLKSIFDPHSEGHDGAVIIEGVKVTQFGVHLPLSKNFKQLGRGGTRHAAALGLSELCDALCLVVSEEKGAISVARHGEIEKISDAEELSEILERFYREIHPRQSPTRRTDYFTKNVREKGMAIGIATLLWFLHVYGSKVIYKTFSVPVEYAELPENLIINEVDPPEIEVTFSGPRRSFYFLDKKRIRLPIKTWQIKEGMRTVRLSGSDLVVPKNISIENIDPNRVKLRIEKKQKESPPEPVLPPAE